MRAAAPAKINLSLLVGPRRGDGYHPLDSYVAKIAAFDDVELTSRDEPAISFACEMNGGLTRESIDCGAEKDNLAYRAARLLAERAGGMPSGVHVRLVKRIPPGRGLGGGSSDAAAVLVGLNELWRLRLDEGEMRRLGAKLGSDVPLFLGGSASRMTGRGECLQGVRVFPFFAVLILPAFGVSTAEAYGAFDELGAPAGDLAVRQLSEESLVRPPSKWRDALVNDLADAAMRVCPALAETKRRLRETVALPVCMTGSGSALFVACDHLAEARSVLAAMPSDIAGRSLIVPRCDW